MILMVRLAFGAGLGDELVARSVVDRSVDVSPTAALGTEWGAWAPPPFVVRDQGVEFGQPGQRPLCHFHDLSESGPSCVFVHTDRQGWCRSRACAG